MSSQIVWLEREKILLSSLNPTRNEGQMALILVLLVLAISAVVGVSFLYRMRLEVKAVKSFGDSLKADYLAQAGIERAIATLKNDTNEYDDLYEEWARDFKESLGEGRYYLTPSAYERESFNEDEEKMGIFDEASKINLNMAGAEHLNQGWTPYEINLGKLEGLDQSRVETILKYRYGPDAAPGVKGKDDDKDAKTLESDGIDNDADGAIDEPGEGVDEPDEFRPESPYGDDNPFETVEEIRLVPGIGEKTFDGIRDYITIYSYDKNVNKMGILRTNINTASPHEISRALQRGGMSPDRARQLAVNIVDFRDPDSYPTEHEGRYGIEKTPYINEVMPFFTSSVSAAVEGLIKGGARYVVEKVEEKATEKIHQKIKVSSEAAVKETRKAISEKEPALKKAVESIIKEYQEENESESKKTGFFTLLGEGIAEAGEGKKIRITFEVEWLELFNPYQVPCRVDGWLIETSLRKKVIWGIVPSCSYTLILNIVIKTPKGTIGKPLLNNYADRVILKNKRGNVVDKVSYRNYNAPWNAFEKNDPRVRKFASSLPGGSPGFRNWFWLPMVGEGKDKEDFSSFVVENRSFANIGEVGYIHGEDEWRTVRIQQGGDWRILDEITVADPPEEPVRGRINLNTAPREVLQSLPAVDSMLAKSIIRYCDSKRGPLNEIGEIMEVPLVERWGFNGVDDDKDGYVDEDDEREAIFRGLSNLISVRSNCFTIISLGQVVENEEVRAEKKIKVVVDRGDSPLKVKYYRELSD
jgi:type II secretory pathway component PulK